SKRTGDVPGTLRATATVASFVVETTCTSALSSSGLRLALPRWTRMAPIEILSRKPGLTARAARRAGPGLYPRLCRDSFRAEFGHGRIDVSPRAVHASERTMLGKTAPRVERQALAGGRPRRIVHRLRWNAYARDRQLRGVLTLPLDRRGLHRH